MECPKCKSKLMPVEFSGVEVDRCIQCEGIWFDVTEKEQLKAIDGSEGIDTGDLAKGMEYNKIDNIDCPKCHSQMMRMIDKDQPHIWYEQCGICSGVFFDAGEFKDYKNHTLSDYFKRFTVGPRPMR